jgi:hypothetical protein
MIRQRNSSKQNRKQHYTASGAAEVPFQDKNIGRFGLTRPNDLAISAEEFPFESADVLDETGRLVFIFPVSEVAQNSKLLPITSI